MEDRFCQTRQVKNSSRQNTHSEHPMLFVYDLSFVQQPKCARTVGFGHKIDRSPINPAPVIQLNVINPSGSPNLKKSGSFQPDLMVGDAVAHELDQKRKENIKKEGGPRSKSRSFLQNPYYFMNATLTNATPDAKTGVYPDLHASKDGKNRFLIGSTVSSLYQLQIQLQKDVGVFVFPDLSVRQEGEYRVRFDLYEILGKEIHICRSILSEAFQAFSPKQPPVTDQRVESALPPAGLSTKSRVRSNNLTANKPSKPSSQYKNSRASIGKSLTGGDDHDGDRLSINSGKTKDRRRSASPNSQGVGKRVRVAETEVARYQKEPQTAYSMAVDDASHVVCARGSTDIETNSHGLSHDVAQQHQIRTPSFPSSTPSLSHAHCSRSPHQSDDLLNRSFKSVGSTPLGRYTPSSLTTQAHLPPNLSYPLFYRDHHPHHHPHEQPSNITLPPLNIPPIRRPSSPSSNSSSTTSYLLYHRPLPERSASNETISDDRQPSNVYCQSPIGWSPRTTDSSFPGRFSNPSLSASLDRSSSYGSNISSAFGSAIGHVGGSPMPEGREGYSAGPSRSHTRVITRAVDSSMAPPETTRFDSLSKSKFNPSVTRLSTVSPPPAADRKNSERGPMNLITGPEQVSSAAAASTVSTSIPPTSISTPLASGDRKTFPGLGLKEMLNPSSEEEEKVESCCRRHPPSENPDEDSSAPSNSAITPSFSASRMGLYNLLS
ncbi:Velvet factor [Phaffia rhodozyma]|uniref:Velvet factor n=1 Tax=Phaffia rhodozyma TaxID=264483 RepID=A0A0F7SVN2_PHARH|nr:Velvet factor [Phaffia rhodozyma]